MRGWDFNCNKAANRERRCIRVQKGIPCHQRPGCVRPPKIIVQWPGSTHDAYIWGNSRLREWLEGQTYIGHLLGDQAYPLKQYLMTPLRNPHTQADRAFNAAHKKARQRIEDTFGRWKSRWMCIHKYGKFFKH